MLWNDKLMVDKLYCAYCNEFVPLMVMDHKMVIPFMLRRDFSWGPLLRDVSRLDANQDPPPTTSISFAMGMSMARYSMYLNSKTSSNGDVNEVMNDVIKEKLKIIPKDVRFEHQEENRKDCLRTLYALIEDAMKADRKKPEMLTSKVDFEQIHIL